MHICKAYVVNRVAPISHATLDFVRQTRVGCSNEEIFSCCGGWSGGCW